MTSPPPTPLLSPDLYQALWQHSTDLVSIIDAAGIVRYASPSYRRTLGYDPAAIVGTSSLTRIHPADRDRIRAALQDAQHRPGAVVSARFRYQHADGSRRVLEVTGANHLDDPVVRGFVVNGRDVTDRVEVEEQLREREEQYRSVFQATSDALVIVDADNVLVDLNPAAEKIWGYDRDEMVGEPQRILNADVLAAIEEQGFFVTRTTNQHKDGSTIHLEGRVIPFTHRGSLHYLATIRDITAEVEAYELLEQRVAERTRELSTVLDVSRTVASTLELQPLLSLILDSLHSVVDSVGSSISAIDGDDLVMLQSRGPENEEHLTNRRYPAPHDQQLWQLLLHGEPVIIDDVRDNTPLGAAYRAALGADLDDPGFTYVRAWMGVPLRVKDRVVGVLGLSDTKPGAFSVQHADLAMAIAQQAAIAIENARLYEKAQEVAVLEERQRLSRELHDSVSQALYSIGLGAKTARALLERDPARAIEPLDFAIAQAERGLAEMRALIFELRPDALEHEGLVGALDKQRAAIETRHHIRVELAPGPEPDLPLAAKEALYRIALEAINNTVKHAQAATLRLTLAGTPTGTTLTIEDDGRGFDTGASFPGHLGLHSMRERAARLGGTFHLESAPGVGTTIRAFIPCP